MTRFVRRVSLLLLLVLGASVLLPTDANAQSDDDPVQRLNGAFREAYAKARAEVLKQSGPVIIVRGDGLILINGEQRVAGSLVDTAYHDLKTVAHVPLTIYSLLASRQDGKIDEQLVADLREIRELIINAGKTFHGRLDDPDLETRQRSMLQTCIRYIDQLLESERYTRAALLKLTMGSVRQIQENLAVATKYRIDNYHRQALKWRKMLSDEQWARLHVLIPGSPMARKDSLAVQYFAKLFGERGEGSRIVYAESLFAEPAALNLLGTHLFDSQIGEAFFSDRWRMHRDVLGTATAKYLETLRFRED